MNAAILPILILSLAGCHSVPPVLTPSPEPLPLPGRPENYAGLIPDDEPAAEAAAAEAQAADGEFLDERHGHWLAALGAENDFLADRLRELEENAAAASDVSPLPLAAESEPLPLPVEPLAPTAPNKTAAIASELPPSQPPAPVPAPRARPHFVPNAEGVIDVTALVAEEANGPANPFVVRRLPTEAVHEVTLAVQGIFSGPHPCALVNERVVAVGDTIESLRLAGIGDSLRFEGDRFTLELPLGSTRVRLPL